MLGEYLPVLLQIIVAALFAGSALIVSVLVGKSGKRTPAKDTPYECGMISGVVRVACSPKRCLGLSIQA